MKPRMRLEQKFLKVLNARKSATLIAASWQTGKSRPFIKVRLQV